MLCCFLPGLILVAQSSLMTHDSWHMFDRLNNWRKSYFYFWFFLFCISIQVVLLFWSWRWVQESTCFFWGVQFAMHQGCWKGGFDDWSSNIHFIGIIFPQQTNNPGAASATSSNRLSSSWYQWSGRSPLQQGWIRSNTRRQSWDRPSNDQRIGMILWFIWISFCLPVCLAFVDLNEFI